MYYLRKLMGGRQSSNACIITIRTDEIYHYNITECKYDWTVANFRNLTFTVGQCITSERLKIEMNGTNDEWEVVLYPGGFNERTADFLSVWLRKVSTGERLVQFTCEISSSEQLILKKGKTFIKKTIDEKLSLESVVGWSAFCKRSHILAEGADILEEGNLVLKCTLRIFDNKFIPDPAVEDDDPKMGATLSELSDNFSQLFQSKDPGDVIFEFNGELLHAHKAVLRARSPVFRAMFDSKLNKEAQKIPIKDVSKDTFLAMLQFIYSGKHTSLDFGTHMELYYTADKYELISLRKICSKILANKLNTENAVQVVALAHQHGDIFLQDIAVDYIARNASVIQKRPDWTLLMTSSPIVANAVIQKLTQMNDKNK